MFKLVKCTVVFNLKIKRQCLSVCGYHTSQLLSSNNVKYSTSQQKPKYQSVADFYAGKSVFLTGGTGFLGKVFIEKLLSNCSQLDKIYVLIRGRKGAPPEHRLQKLLQTPVFTKLRTKNPEYLSKVVAIAGDITETKLGIKPEDEQILIDKVSVVFHSAATVKFNDTFKDIINVNVEGTRRVLNLSQQMKNIEIFVHISTAFSNSDKVIVEEIVYPPPKKLEDVKYFVKNHANDQKEIENYTKGHANVYSFSKGLAESLVLENHGNTPAIIVRPSVVSPVLKEPMPGWIDSWVANTALFSDTARGLTRIFYGTDKTILDMIPVDYVCNLAIAAAAKAPKSKEVTVYNSCSSSTNPITWKGATDMFVKESVNFGYRELPFPKVFVSESALVVSAVTFISQIIPFTADLWLRVTGRKPKYMAAQTQANLLRDLIKNFTSGAFLAKTDRAEELMSSLDENDRQKFQFDPKTIDWKKYVSIHCFGVKQYLLPDKNK